MIKIFAVTLLLGTSAVLGDIETCSEAQELLWKGPLAWEQDAVEARYFEYKFDFIRGSSKQHKGTEHTFNVLETFEDDPLPTVFIDGTFYELLNLAVIPLSLDESTAALQVSFVNFRTKSPKKFASFVIPLRTNRDDTNAALNKDLAALSTVSKDDTHTTNLSWLEPVLKRVVRMNNAAEIACSVQRYHNLFLTGCLDVSADVLTPFFTAIKETAQNVVYYPAPEEQE